MSTPAPCPMEQRGLGRVANWLLGPGSQARTRRLVILILFPALTLVGTLHFDFVFDDNIVVLGDPLVVGQVRPHEIFGSEVRVAEVALGYYRPLITLLYRADRALWGTNPAGYHLTNLLWHLLATLLVYLVALQTLEKPLAAWAAALLFSVLPAHTEAIGWIQGRVDLVSTVLALLTLFALVRARHVPKDAGGAWAYISGAAFLGALMAKESAAALPLAWLIWEAATPRNVGWRERLKTLSGQVAPLVVAGVLYWLLRRWATRARVPRAGPTWSCAYAHAAPRMQYTAASFATPLLGAFGRIAAPEVEPTAASLRTRSGDRILDGLVRPLWDRTRAVAAAFRPLQQGPITRYLQYIVLTVLVLLGALFVSLARHR